MILTETVVAYDAADRGSVRHLVKRNGQHVALCGDKLRPAKSIRYLEGFDTDRDMPEADCRPCLFARARWMVETMFGRVPEEAAKHVNAAGDPDEKIVLLLRVIAKGTSLQESALIREHFPRVLVERATA